MLIIGASGGGRNSIRTLRSVLASTGALVIVVTDQVGWPLALWIATTVGPLTALKIRFDPNEATDTATNG